MLSIGQLQGLRICESFDSLLLGSFSWQRWADASNDDNWRGTRRATRLRPGLDMPLQRVVGTVLRRIGTTRLWQRRRDTLGSQKNTQGMYTQRLLGSSTGVLKSFLKDYLFLFWALRAQKKHNESLRKL